MSIIKENKHKAYCFSHEKDLSLSKKNVEGGV